MAVGAIKSSPSPLPIRGHLRTPSCPSISLSLPLEPLCPFSCGMVNLCSVSAVDVVAGPRTTASSTPSHPPIKPVEWFPLLSSPSWTCPFADCCAVALAPSPTAGGDPRACNRGGAPEPPPVHGHPHRRRRIGVALPSPGGRRQASGRRRRPAAGPTQTASGPSRVGRVPRERDDRRPPAWRQRGVLVTPTSGPRLGPAPLSG